DQRRHQPRRSKCSTRKSTNTRTLGARCARVGNTADSVTLCISYSPSTATSRPHPGIRRRARRSAGAETAGRAWHLGRACAEALAYWFASRPPEDHDLLEALQERSENFGGPQDPRLAG